MNKLLAWSLSLIIFCGALAFSENDKNEVKEIVITATKTKREIKDISGDISIITSENITESNATTLDQVLTNQTGIDIAGGDFLGLKPRLNMRGLQGNFGAQRVLVLMDGRPINEEYMGDVDFRTLSLDNIERIEIVRGPSSALYGSNAMGGVINLITKQPTDKLSGGLKSFVGSFNTYGTALQNSAKFGEFGYFITANQESTDGYLLNSDGTPKNWQSKNVTGKVVWTPDKKSNLTLAMGHNNGDGHDEGFLRDLTTNYQDLVYRNNWANENNAGFLARVYVNSLDQALKWNFGFTGKYDQSTLGTQLQQSFLIAKKHLLTGGIDTKKENVLVKETNGTIDETINSSAIYLQDEFSINTQLLLTAGLRYDRNEEFGGETSPRIGAVYHLNNNTSFRSAIGKAYRSPTISDLFLPQTSYFGMTFEGNPNLKPETTWTVEAGWDNKFTDKLSSKLTIYDSSLSDAWDFMRDSDNIFRPQNVTKMSIKGVETEIDYLLMKGIISFANYTFNDSKYKKDKTNPAIEGNHVEDIPFSEGTLGLRLQPEKSSTTINLTLKGTSRRYTDPENNQLNQLPKFLVMNVDITAKVNENSSIFITVNNLFDRAYKEVIDYSQPGRWFSSGISLLF